MTNEQILKKAIEKAEKNGYKLEEYFNPLPWKDHINDIIFSHRFAKAFWGEERNMDIESYQEEFIKGKQKLKLISHQRQKYISSPLWKYHLQQMVLEEEPLQYLKKFLDN